VAQQISESAQADADKGKDIEIQQVSQRRRQEELILNRDSMIDYSMSGYGCKKFWLH